MGLCGKNIKKDGKMWVGKGSSQREHCSTAGKLAQFDGKR